MKLIDSAKINPEYGTLRYKFCRFFNDYINWCHGYYYDKKNPDNPTLPLDKPYNKLYAFFYDYWLFPFKQNDCICCNTVRGLIYGAVLGYAIRGFL